MTDIEWQAMEYLPEPDSREAEEAMSAEPDPEFEEWRAEVCGELPGAALPDGGDVDPWGDLDRVAAERLLKRMALVTSERTAALLYIDAEIAEAEAVVERLKARRLEMAQPYERKLAFLGGFFPALEAWAREALQYAKARSLKLAYGTLKFRKNPPRLDVTNEEAAISWATIMCPEAVKTTVQKAVLKAHVKATGEVPLGCEWAAGEEVFTVETEDPR